MTFAMVCPCASPPTSVRRIIMSRVPLSISLSGWFFFTIRLSTRSSMQRNHTPLELLWEEMFIAQGHPYKPLDPVHWDPHRLRSHTRHKRANLIVKAAGNQDERHPRGRITAIGPRMVGSSLDHDIPGLERNIAVGENKMHAS